jgi:hypothetical protein
MRSSAGSGQGAATGRAGAQTRHDRRACVWLLVFAGLAVAPVARAAPPASLSAQRWIVATDPEYDLLREAYRAGGDARGPGSGVPLSREEAAGLAGAQMAAVPRWHDLARWLGVPLAGEATPPAGEAGQQGDAQRALGGRRKGDEPPLGLLLTPQVQVLGFAADPHRQLQPLFLDVRGSEAADPAVRLRAGLAADARLLPSLSACVQFYFDSAGRNDSHTRTREFATLNSSNDVEQAYLRYASRRWSVVLGRTWLSFGPERLGGLILSNEAPALDMIHGELRLGHHRLQAFAAQLSSDTVVRRIVAAGAAGASDTLQTTESLGRYLYGHRLDLFLSRSLRVGLSETAVVSEVGRGPQLKYLNPVLFYAQAQVEHDNNPSNEVNVFNGVDADVFVRPAHVYGELVVDDLQLDRQQRKRWPDQLAWAVGADFPSTGASAWLIGYEYRRIGSWTYLHPGPGVDAQQFDRPLGSPEGPDTDRHDLRVALRPAPGWLCWVEGERRRRGENRLWTEQTREGHALEPFPRGRVERRWVLSGGAQRTLAPYGQLGIALAWHSIEQVNNTQDRLDVLELRASLTLRAPGLAAHVDGDPP